MANAIKQISVAAGHDVTRYTLQCFGGAGGQHACLVADALGMRRCSSTPGRRAQRLRHGPGRPDVIREQAVELPLDAEGWLPLQGRCSTGWQPMRGSSWKASSVSGEHR
jgi:5-oxoprolinase (ATP-hydrolysing)